MLRTCLYIILLLNCIISSVSEGQTRPGSSIYAEQDGEEQYISVQQNGDVNQSRLIQRGEDNSFDIRQQSYYYYSGPSGSMDNIISAEVQGEANRASVEQTGVGNECRLYMQGRYNEFSAIQSGEGNLIMHQVQGNDSDWRVEQYGSNNTFIHESSELIPTEGAVIQKGEGIRIILRDGM